MLSSFPYPSPPSSPSSPPSLWTMPDGSASFKMTLDSLVKSVREDMDDIIEKWNDNGTLFDLSPRHSTRRDRSTELRVFRFINYGKCKDWLKENEDVTKVMKIALKLGLNPENEMRHPEFAKLIHDLQMNVAMIISNVVSRQNALELIPSEDRDQASPLLDEIFKYIDDKYTAEVSTILDAIKSQSPAARLQFLKDMVPLIKGMENISKKTVLIRELGKLSQEIRDTVIESMEPSISKINNCNVLSFVIQTLAKVPEEDQFEVASLLEMLFEGNCDAGREMILIDLLNNFSPNDICSALEIALSFIEGLRPNEAFDVLKEILSVSAISIAVVAESMAKRLNTGKGRLLVLEIVKKVSAYEEGLAAEEQHRLAPRVQEDLAVEEQEDLVRKGRQIVVSKEDLIGDMCRVTAGLDDQRDIHSIVKKIANIYPQNLRSVLEYAGWGIDKTDFIADRIDFINILNCVSINDRNTCLAKYIANDNTTLYELVVNQLPYFPMNQWKEVIWPLGPVLSGVANVHEINTELYYMPESRRKEAVIALASFAHFFEEGPLRAFILRKLSHLPRTEHLIQSYQNCIDKYSRFFSCRAIAFKGLHTCDDVSDLYNYFTFPGNEEVMADFQLAGPLIVKVGGGIERIDIAEALKQMFPQDSRNDIAKRVSALLPNQPTGLGVVALLRAVKKCMDSNQLDSILSEVGYLINHIPDCLNRANYLEAILDTPEDKKNAVQGALELLKKMFDKDYLGNVVDLIYIIDSPEYKIAIPTVEEVTKWCREIPAEFRKGRMKILLTLIHKNIDFYHEDRSFFGEDMNLYRKNMSFYQPLFEVYNAMYPGEDYPMYPVAQVNQHITVSDSSDSRSRSSSTSNSSSESRSRSNSTSNSSSGSRSRSNSSASFSFTPSSNSSSSSTSRSSFNPDTSTSSEASPLSILDTLLALRRERVISEPN